MHTKQQDVVSALMREMTILADLLEGIDTGESPPEQLREIAFAIADVERIRLNIEGSEGR